MGYLERNVFNHVLIFTLLGTFNDHEQLFNRFTYGEAPRNDDDSRHSKPCGNSFVSVFRDGLNIMGYQNPVMLGGPGEF